MRTLSRKGCIPNLTFLFYQAELGADDSERMEVINFNYVR